MRHRRQVKTFRRKTGPRKALIRGLVEALVKHGRIKTTVEKAKELRRHVERAVTIGKANTLHCRRLLLSRYPSEETALNIVNNISPRFKDRAGGYTRIIKLGRRPGDSAEMALIEFVDYNYDKVKKPDEAPTKQKKLTEKKVSVRKKSVRTIKAKSRRKTRS